MGALTRNSFCSRPSANRSARPIKKGRVRTEGHHNSLAPLQWIEIALSLFEKKTCHIKKWVPHNKKQPYANPPFLYQLRIITWKKKSQTHQATTTLPAQHTLTRTEHTHPPHTTTPLINFNTTTQHQHLILLNHLHHQPTTQNSTHNTQTNPPNTTTHHNTPPTTTTQPQPKHNNIRRITDSAGLRVPPSEELGNAGSPMPWLRACYGRFPIRFMRPSLLASLIGQGGKRNAAHATKWISKRRLKVCSAVLPRAARTCTRRGLDRPGSRRKPLSRPISACYTTRARMMLRFLSGVGHAENHHFIPAR